MKSLYPMKSNDETVSKEVRKGKWMTTRRQGWTKGQSGGRNRTPYPLHQS